MAKECESDKGKNSVMGCGTLHLSKKNKEEHGVKKSCTDSKSGERNMVISYTSDLSKAYYTLVTLFVMLVITTS